MKIKSQKDFWSGLMFIVTGLGFAAGATVKMNAVHYHTVPQPGLNGRQGFQPRGQVMGGSSAINAMMPPSPSLSARMMMVTYFTVTTMVNAQNTSDSTPSTVSWLAINP